MEKGQGKGTDTLQTDNVFTRKEYVEREAARDLLDMALEDDWEIEYANDRLDAIPAADVVPAVRCGECKHGQRTKMDFWNEYEGIECISGIVHRKNWYCADGERKDGDKG